MHCLLDLKIFLYLFWLTELLCNPSYWGWILVHKQACSLLKHCIYLHQTSTGCDEKLLYALGKALWAVWDMLWLQYFLWYCRTTGFYKHGRTPSQPQAIPLHVPWLHLPIHRWAFAYKALHAGFPCETFAHYILWNLCHCGTQEIQADFYREWHHSWGANFACDAAWKDATFAAPVKKADLPVALLSDCQKAVQELKSDNSRADKNCFMNPSPIKSGPYNGNKATVAVSSGKCVIQLVTSTAKPTGDQLTCSKTADIANATITRLISAQKGVLMTGGLATASDNSYWVAVTTCDGPLAPCTGSKAAPAKPAPAAQAANSAGGSLTCHPVDADQRRQPPLSIDACPIKCKSSYAANIWTMPLLAVNFGPSCTYYLWQSGFNAL